MNMDARNEHSMIKVSIEVKNEDSTFTVAACAKSIESAVNSVKGLYSADEARVLFPVEPESFFVNGGPEIVHRDPEKTEDRNPAPPESPVEPGESFSGAKARTPRLPNHRSGATTLPVFTGAGL